MAEEWAINRKSCWERMFLSVLCFVETGSCSPGCPQICSIVEDSLDFLIPSVSASQMLELGVSAPVPGLNYVVLGIEPEASCILSKHSTN